ncbi:ribbon-helix-helix domain-containing protein [Sphingomonas jeddahensis]|uniref:Ribbon-helix-helix domain-containing protein n=1 Tax=Sphingomonas jeddahensis TaxID=1915074 RepID=A0A1V2ESG2_9SPHN|nr:ribbon-helix-helix domain-containing protein [Sphingomonas jeddahensis]ONF95520.1 hypothetical protein SPHI_21870 [Sphingomonas jeddahensis]
MRDDHQSAGAPERSNTRIQPPRGGFVGPVKRSITIAGHPTSISLEPLFWRALEREASGRRLPVSALVAEIDALRIIAADPPNLASALRIWLADVMMTSE